MNRYVKVEGHPNWFLVLSQDDIIPIGLNENMQEMLTRSELCKLHNPVETPDLLYRLKHIAVNGLDYGALIEKYGTILIRPIGSFMLLTHNNIIAETFDNDFPIEDFGEIVICENDAKAEYHWVLYLQKRFPNSKIVTINYFDLRSENEVEKYFDRAKYITFSTTFSNLGWYEKLTKFASKRHKIIGYCADAELTKLAMEINSNVEMVEL